jgi:hypothetical protein
MDTALLPLDDPPTAEPAVEVHALARSFGGRPAIDGVDLRLEQGRLPGGARSRAARARRRCCA